VKAFLASIEKVIRQRLARISRRVGAPPEALDAMVGKMLRSRLGAHLAASGLNATSEEVIQAACVATELIHTATLQQQTVPRRPGLMRKQLSSLPTSFLRLFITPTAVEKSIIYGRRSNDSSGGKMLDSA
jgi:hypothetical protein